MGLRALASFFVIAALTAASFSGCGPMPGLDLQGSWAAPGGAGLGGATLTVTNDQMDFKGTVLRQNADGTSTPSLAVHWKGFFGIDNQETPADGKWQATMHVDEIDIEPLTDGVVRVFNQQRICGRTNWALGAVQRLGGAHCLSEVTTFRLTGNTIYTVVKIQDGKLWLGKSTPDHDGSDYDKRTTELSDQPFTRI